MALDFSAFGGKPKKKKKNVFTDKSNLGFSKEEINQGTNFIAPRKERTSETTPASTIPKITENLQKPEDKPKVKTADKVFGEGIANEKGYKMQKDIIVKKGPLQTTLTSIRKGEKIGEIALPEGGVFSIKENKIIEKPTLPTVSELGKARDVFATKSFYTEEWEKRQRKILRSAEKLPDGYKEPNIIGQIVDSIKFSTVNNLSALGSSLESLGYTINSRELVNRGARISDRFKEVIMQNPEWQEPQSEKYKGTPSYYARLISGAIPSIGGTIMTSVLGTLAAGPTGGAIAGFTFAKQLEGGAAYDEARRYGASPTEANRISQYVGNINGILEYLPVGRILNRTKAGKKLTQNIFKRVAKEMAKQGITEGSTEAVQEIVLNAFLMEIDQNRGLFDNTMESLIAGGGAGMLFGGGNTIITSQELKEQLKKIAENQEGFVDYRASISDDISKAKAEGKSFEEFVDNKGEPLYHGTNAKFDVFDESKIGSATDEGLYGRGFYFGNTKAFAEIAPKGRLAKNVIEAYPTSNNLFEINKIKSVKEMADLLNMSENALIKETNGIIRPVRGQVNQFTSHVEELGYDGVVINRGGDAIETVIFKSENIKTKSQLKQLWDKGVKKPRALSGAEKVRITIRAEKKEAISNIVKKYKAKEENIKEVKKDLISYAKEYLELRERGKLLSQVKNAKTKKNLAKGVAYIERLAEESQGRTLLAKIQKVAKKTIVTGKKPKGKYTAEVQESLDKVRSLITLNQKQAREKIESNLKQYAQKMPAEIALENKILSLLTGTNQEKQQLLDIVNKIIEKGELDNALKKFNNKEELDRKKGFLIERITGGKGIEENRLRGEPRKKTTIENVKQYLKGVGKNTILSWRGLMTGLDFNTSVKEKDLADFFSVVKNESKYKQLQVRYIETFNENISKIYGIKNSPNSIFKQTVKLTKEILNINGIQMTRDEVVKRWMEIQDPSLRDSFVEGNGYTEKTFEAIEKAMTPQDKAFANWQLDYYKQLYNEVNKVYSNIYGVNLPFNEFYSPIRRSGVKQEAGNTEFLEEAFYRTAVTNKSLFSRVANLHPIEKQGSLKALDKHLSEMNYFIAWSETIRELDSIFTDPKVRSSVKQEMPDSYLKAIDRKLQDIAQNGNKTSLKVGWIDNLRKNYVIGNLAAKPALAVKQLVSTLAYLEEIGPIDLTIGILDFVRNPIKNYKTLSNESAFIKTRGEGMERDIREAISEGVFERYKKKQNLANKLMINVKLGDKGAILLGSWSMRRSRLKQGFKLNDIISEYEEFASETQQSADVSRLSNVQLAGTFAKLFTMFKSSQRAYLQKEANAVKSMFRKDGFTPKNLRKVSKTLFIYHVLLPIFFQYVSNLGGWDEDDRKDYLRAGLLGSINGLFIAGDVVDSMIRHVLGMRIWDSEVPIQDVADDILKIMNNLDFNDIGSEEFYTALDALSSAGTGLSGLPLEYTYDIIESLYRENYEKGIKQLMGWSEYYIDTEKEKKPTKGFKVNLNKLNIKKTKVNTGNLKTRNLKVNLSKIR